MTKKQEILNAGSCFNRAGEDEFMFVLLGRDPAAPAAIRAWCEERVRLGKNTPDDHEIVTAVEASVTLDALRRARGEILTIMEAFRADGTQPAIRHPRLP